MKKVLFILLGTFIFSLSAQFGFAQSISVDSLRAGQKVMIRMINGDEFTGTFQQKADSVIIIATANGTLHLNVGNLRSIEKDNYTGNFRFQNLHDTRYFFGPTGFQLKKNKGYYQNILLTSNFFHYGVTNNFSIGGGFEFATLITGHPVWFITPKVGFEVAKNVHAAAGLLFLGIANEGSAALGYGVITLGSSESNITAGLGYGYLSGEISKTPVITIGGTHRVGNGIALLSENYLIPDSQSNFTVAGLEGIRLLFPKNAFDFGIFLIPSASNAILPLPFVGFAKHF